jgi:hypothetical protein
MTDDLVVRLAAQGIDVPELEPLPSAAGVTVLGFPSEGDEAVSWWRRLHAVHESTGFWPVLITVDEAVGWPDDTEAGLAQRLARAAELDVAELLNHRGKFESLDDSLKQEMLQKWPEDSLRIAEFFLPYLPYGRYGREPARVLVALVAAEHGWQMPALLNYGGWDSCPEPAVHSAVLRHWHHRYGAEIVCMPGIGQLELAVTRPPRTRLEALDFAWEYIFYCLDGMASPYEADDIQDLAACLIDAEIVRFYWD